MSRHATDWAWETDPGSSSLKLILLSMADRADEYNLCYIEQHNWHLKNYSEKRH